MTSTKYMQPTHFKMTRIKDLTHRLLVEFCPGSPRSPPRKKQGPKCFLLNMPLEIIYLIFDRLPASSQMCLILACYDLQNALSPLRSKVLYNGLENRIGYLGLVAKDYPDHWVDDTRAMLVKMKKDDLPKEQEGPPVFRTPGWGCYNIDRFERGALMIENKQVQIAIKYSQLQKKTWRQKKNLKALLKPYGTEFSPGLAMHPNYASSLTGNFWTCPKIVSGNYLVFNQWIFVKKDGPIRLGELGRFGPCLHQHTEPGRSYYNYILRHLYSKMRGSASKTTGTCSIPERKGNRHNRSDIFFGCLQKGFQSQGSPVHGACPWCCTEFSVLVKPGTLTLSVWRDLGGAYSPLDPVWKGHFRPIGDPDTPGVKRDPLEIRARYGILPTKGLR